MKWKRMDGMIQNAGNQRNGTKWNGAEHHGMDLHHEMWNKMEWDETKQKAQDRLNLLIATKAAWEGYAESSENIVAEFERAEEEMEKIKKKFDVDAAKEDLAKRQDIFNKQSTSRILDSALFSHTTDKCFNKDKDNHVCGVAGCTSHHHPVLHGSKDIYVTGVNTLLAQRLQEP